ncbi:MAG: hypothetical protein KDJ80_08675 [Nitratireductor sp.]|nr:hypothetical protein [Nitratireductor sp.]
MAKIDLKSPQRAFELFHPGFAQALMKEQAEAKGKQLIGMLDSDDLSARALLSPNQLYNQTGTGKFANLPRIVLNGFYEDRTPKFVFERNKSKPFSFTDSTGRKLTPGDMDTDGGSIPRFLHGNVNYSPWGYGLGYIVHDWVFVAHKCKSKPDDNLTFDDSARLMAETLKTMMEVGFTDYDGQARKYPKNILDVYWIHLAVSSKIARDLWDKKPTLKCR